MFSNRKLLVRLLTAGQYFSSFFNPDNYKDTPKLVYLPSLSKSSKVTEPKQLSAKMNNKKIIFNTGINFGSKYRYRPISPLMSIKWILLPKMFKELEYLSSFERKVKTVLSIDNVFRTIWNTNSMASSLSEEDVIIKNKSTMKEPKDAASHSLSYVNFNSVIQSESMLKTNNYIN